LRFEAFDVAAFPEAKVDLAFDRTHIFFASYTVESPWFRNSKGIVGGPAQPGATPAHRPTPGRDRSLAPIHRASCSLVGSSLSKTSRTVLHESLRLGDPAGNVRIMVASPQPVKKRKEITSKNSIEVQKPCILLDE